MSTLPPTFLALAALATAQDALAPTAPVPGWVDFDRDGHVDAVLLDPGGPLTILRNAGDDRFEDATELLGLSGLSGATQALWDDVDGDEALDLLVVVPGGTSRLFRATTSGTFEPADAGCGLALDAGVRRAEWLQVDGDTLPDLLLETATGRTLYRNDGGARFVPLDVRLGAPAIGAAPVPGASTHGGTGAGGTGSAGPMPGGASASATAALGGVSNPTIDPAPPLGALGGSQSCAFSLNDTATGGCLMGSSTPTLGSLYPISSDWFVKPANGFVGLGTTSPTKRLDVAGTVRSRSGGFEFPDGSVQATASLWEENGGDMFVGLGVKVGVGTNLPQAKLHVNGGNVLVDRAGGSNLTRDVTLVGARQGGGSSFASLNFDNFDADASNQAVYTGASISSHNVTSDRSGDLRFQTNDGSGTSVSLLIGAGGDVGIGTVSPAAKLDVDGEVRSRSGGFRFPDGSVQDSAVFTQTQYYAVGAGSFISQNTTYGVTNSVSQGVWMNTVAAKSILAPVHLPHGAHITKMTAYINDTAAADLRIRIWRKVLGTSSSGYAPGFDIFFQSPPAGRSSASASSGFTVDQTQGATFIEVVPTNGDDWPGNSSLSVESIILEWHL